MRLALLITITTAAGLGACAPIPGNPYGYAAPGSYGYYDGGYAPGPYYPDRGYAPVYGTPGYAPGPAIIVGGERRFDDRERYRNYERPRNEGAYRGNPNPPAGRDFGRSAPPQQNFGGNRPAPTPVAVSRPAPQAVPAAPSGGAAFEQWNRTHVNASPVVGADSGGR